MITNPKPLSIGTLSAYWITRLNISPVTIMAVAAPWDATSGYYVGNPSALKRVHQIFNPNPTESEATQLKASAARTVRDTLVAEASRLADENVANFVSLDVSARNPEQPCRVSVRFTGRARPFDIPDLFAACAADAGLAAAYEAVMTWLAMRPELQ